MPAHRVPPRLISPSKFFKMRPAFVCEAVGPHKATLVFIHGLGDNGQGWSVELGHFLSKTGVKIVCPNAPISPVSANRGMKMPSWFDIVAFDEKVLLDESKDPAKAIVESSSQVKDVVREECRHIDSKHVFVGGFSQGGCVALHAGLSFELPLGGIISCSGWAAGWSLVKVFLLSNAFLSSFLCLKRFTNPTRKLQSNFITASTMKLSRLRALIFFAPIFNQLG